MKRCNLLSMHSVSLHLKIIKFKNDYDEKI